MHFSKLYFLGSWHTMENTFIKLHRLNVHVFGLNKKRMYFKNRTAVRRLDDWVGVSCFLKTLLRLMRGGGSQTIQSSNNRVKAKTKLNFGCQIFKNQAFASVEKVSLCFQTHLTIHAGGAQFLLHQGSLAVSFFYDSFAKTEHQQEIDSKNKDQAPGALPLILYILQLLKCCTWKE